VETYAPSRGRPPTPHLISCAAKSLESWLRPARARRQSGLRPRSPRGHRGLLRRTPVGRLGKRGGLPRPPRRRGPARGRPVLRRSLRSDPADPERGTGEGSLVRGNDCRWRERPGPVDGGARCSRRVHTRGTKLRGEPRLDRTTPAATGGVEPVSKRARGMPARALAQGRRDPRI
jgi:hypothetical protein